MYFLDYKKNVLVKDHVSAVNIMFFLEYGLDSTVAAINILFFLDC
jgi:hypothetical protein